MTPDDFKNIPFDRNPNFVTDTNREIIGEAKDIWESIDEAKENKIKSVTIMHGFLVDNNGNVVAGKDEKPKAVEVNNDN
jgi:hypothetical protein